MCPSYKATREEKHSTRGRARLLFETMRGEVIKDVWQSEEMKESLDLCLACKGCKGDCPVNVDMATYKAEFLSHYYEHRAASPPGLCIGWIDRWARLAAHAPGGVNWLTQTPGLSSRQRILRGCRNSAAFRILHANISDWFKQRRAAQ